MLFSVVSMNSLYRSSFRAASCDFVDRILAHRKRSTKSHETSEKQNRIKSITQLVLKNETADLNLPPAVDRRTDELGTNHGALAIDARVDIADGFTACGPVEAHANGFVVYSLISKNILARLQEHAANLQRRLRDEEMRVLTDRKSVV